MFCRALEPEDAALLAKTAKGWFPEGTAVLLGLYLALRALEMGSVNVRPLISERIPLRDAEKAVERARAPGSLKVLIDAS